MNNGNGSIPKDMALTSLSTSLITSKLISSIEHVDNNIIEDDRFFDTSAFLDDDTRR